MCRAGLKRIAIIVEGSVAIGLGHVQRMLVLARALQRNAEVTFVTKSEDAVQRRLSAAGFGVAAAGEGYEAALHSLGPLDTVIIDRLDVDEALAAWARRQTHAKVAIFGNVSAANRHAHLVVNAVIGTRLKNRRYRDAATGTLYLEGSRYVMLGDAFRDRRGAYVHRGRLDRILLTFGGSDQANLTCRTARRLRAAGSTAALTLCVGAIYPHEEELGRLAADMAEEGRELRIVRDSNAVADMMLDADLVVTSPGNSLFEAFSLGVPAVAFFQTPEQAQIFDGFPCCHAQGQVDDVGRLAEATYWNYQHHRSLVEPLATGEGFQEIIDALERPLS